MDHPSVKQRVKAKIVPEWRQIYKRWSAQIIGISLAGQGIWLNLPDESKVLVPHVELIGMALGIAALLATFVKQGKADASSDE
jgi:hypothetical protein